MKDECRYMRVFDVGRCVRITKGTLSIILRPHFTKD